MSGDRWEPLVEFEVGPEDDLDPEFTRSLIPWEKEGGCDDSPPQPHIRSQDIKTLPSPPKDARSTCPDRGTVSRSFSQTLTTPPVVWDWKHVLSITYWLEIPGVGGRASEDCGAFFKKLVCSGCGVEYQAIKKSCHNRSCSLCWEDWLNRAVSRICERLLGYKQAYEAWAKENERRRRRMGNPKSLILSPPPSEWEGYKFRSEEDVKRFVGRLRRKAKRLLRKLGLHGGVLIFHAYRIRDELKELLKSFNRPFWELVRADVLNLGSWKRYVVFGPHFHVLAYGRLGLKSDDFHARTGWIYKFGGHRSEKEWEATVRYFLSHATFVGRCDCYTFFGNMAESCLVAEISSESEEELFCDKCGSPLVWEYYDGMRIPAVIRRVIKIYRFRRLAKAKGYG